MSIIVLRDALLSQRTLWRRLLLGLSAVAAIVAGLLAMHSLNIASHHNEVVVAQHSETLVAQPAAADHHHPASTDVLQGTEQVGSCGEGCDMSSMLGGCILALLVTSALLAGAATVSRSSGVHVILTRIIAAAASLAAPVPPSLQALSISRT